MFLQVRLSHMPHLHKDIESPDELENQQNQGYGREADKSHCDKSHMEIQVKTEYDRQNKRARDQHDERITYNNTDNISEHDDLLFLK